MTPGPGPDITKPKIAFSISSRPCSDNGSNGSAVVFAETLRAAARPTESDRGRALGGTAQSALHDNSILIVIIYGSGITARRHSPRYYINIVRARFRGVTCPRFPHTLPGPRTRSGGGDAQRPAYVTRAGSAGRLYGIETTRRFAYRVFRFDARHRLENGHGRVRVQCAHPPGRDFRGFTNSTGPRRPTKIEASERRVQGADPIRNRVLRDADCRVIRRQSYERLAGSR